MKAVRDPIQRSSSRAVSLYSNNGEIRSNKKTPATTIVAACRRADTGVGIEQDLIYQPATQPPVLPGGQAALWDRGSPVGPRSPSLESLLRSDQGRGRRPPLRPQGFVRSEEPTSEL